MAGNTTNLLGDRQNYGFNKLRENQRINPKKSVPRHIIRLLKTRDK